MKTSIIAVEKVPKEKISSYGIIKGKEVEGDIYLIEDLVEKPSPEEAPSNLGILDRYVLTPAIFGAIEQTPPGKGNEIQLTDAVRLTREKIYAYEYFDLPLFPFHPLYTCGLYSGVFGGFSKSS